MSTPNPLQPQGVLEGAASPKSRVRITVLTILALHVVFIGGLLMQGCDKGSPTLSGGASSNAPSTLPSLTDTNYFSSFPGDTSSTTVADSTPSSPPADPFPSTPTSSVPSVGATGTGAVPGLGTAYTAAPVSPIVTTPTPPAGAATEHVIKRGDIIGNLAKQYGVSIQAILDANPGVKPRSLKINDRLLIPPPAPASERREAALEPLPPGAESYIVKRGDNLTTIARKFGVTVNQLRSANSIRGDRILPEQRLIIPPKSGSGMGDETGRTNPTF